MLTFVEMALAIFVSFFNFPNRNLMPGDWIEAKDKSILKHRSAC
jgi:hypothetical protein